MPVAAAPDSASCICAEKGHAGATHHVYGGRSTAHPRETLTHLYELVYRVCSEPLRDWLWHYTVRQLTARARVNPLLSNRAQSMAGLPALPTAKQ